MNGGNCSVHWYGWNYTQEYGYKCTCPQGFVGVQCEIQGMIILSTVVLMSTDFGKAKSYD